MSRQKRSGGGPSRTSQVVAVTRAGIERPHTPEGDPDAQLQMTFSMRAPSPRTTARFRASLVARTRFVDEQVLAALAGGTSQIVIVGAGYDDRALRFRKAGVHYFEVDHPSTQADKQDRLRQVSSDGTIDPALSLVSSDLRTAGLARALDAAGHDPRRPSLFVCEGLLVYLDLPTIGRLLSCLRDRAGAGSVLAVSLAVHDDGLPSPQVVEIANARRRAGDDEPWVTILPRAGHLRLLEETGWAITGALDAADLEVSAERGRSLFVATVPSPR